MGVRRLVQAIVSGVALACALGCPRQDMGPKARQVQQKIVRAAEPVKEETGLAGHFELELDEPVKAGRCYAVLVSFPSGRPAVLQLSSYQEPGDETFPSVFLRVEVSAGTVAELLGQELPATLYVQTGPEGPVWHSPDERPVEFTITAADDTSVEGEVLGGTLVNTHTGQEVAVTGKFSGSLR